MLYPYPSSFPTADVWQLVADFLRTKNLDKKESCHAVWHVAGYGLSLWDTHPPVALTVPVELTDEAAAVMCEDLAKTATTGAVNGPWLQLVLPVLIKYLPVILDKLLGK